MTLEFTFSYKKDSGLAISADELIGRYLFGIPLCTQNGTQISYSDLETHIRNAQLYVEKMFDIKLRKQIIDEKIDFDFDQWKAWGSIKTSYFVKKVLKLVGLIGTVQQTIYPTEWTSTYQINDEYMLYRNVYIVPSGTGSPSNNASVVYLGVTPHLGFYGNNWVPNYWNIAYCTGFDKIPGDLIDVIAKYASIAILNILGDVLIAPGVASKSLSFDGFSQSLSTTASSGGLFGSRIRQYTTELESQTKTLKDWYKGLQFSYV